jgi:hypothetical protein
MILAEISLDRSGVDSSITRLPFPEQMGTKVVTGNGERDIEQRKEKTRREEK